MSEQARTESSTGGGTEGKAPVALVVLAWAWVGVPFLYGLWQLVIKIPALFGG